MNTLPTDYKFRVLLAQAVFGEPEALLLDEPTNHMDLESIHWLGGVPDGVQGTLIVISHDRHFLNAVCTHIADIDYETIIIYPGSYDDMVRAEDRRSARASNRRTATRRRKSRNCRSSSPVLRRAARQPGAVPPEGDAPPRAGD